MNITTRSLYVQFVNRAFRDTADRDYVAARMLYRNQLGPQFLWSALQAIEKYLKAILLFNDQTSKAGHDLRALYKKCVDSMTEFKIPQDVCGFIEYLNDQGCDRYFEKHAYTTGRELLVLDRSVWHIRKYCFWMRGQTTPGPDGKRLDLLPFSLRRLDHPEEKPIKYRIEGGFLEGILAGKKSPLRGHLVWKNVYYGRYQKRRISRFPAHSWSRNQTAYGDPELIKILLDRVQFSGPVKRELEEIIARHRPGI